MLSLNILLVDDHNLLGEVFVLCCRREKIGLSVAKQLMDSMPLKRPKA